MEGAPYEGTFKDGDRWVKVERRYYPRKRWVTRALEWRDGRLQYKDTSTPELTAEQWARFSTWL